MPSIMKPVGHELRGLNTSAPTGMRVQGIQGGRRRAKEHTAKTAEQAVENHSPGRKKGCHDKPVASRRHALKHQELAYEHAERRSARERHYSDKTGDADQRHGLHDA